MTKSDSTVITQGVVDPAHFLGGAIRLTASSDLDAGTFDTVALEQLSGGVWTALSSAQFAVGRGSTATNAHVDVLPLAGFELGKSYRVRVTSGLHDVGGRALSDARVLEFTLPDPVPPENVGTINFEYERSFPVNYDSYFASGTDAGLFPGGQPMVFQGAWTDPITGLQYKRERFYDPRNASWLSQDPMGDRDSANLYGFVAGRPHEFTDPMGTCLGLDSVPCWDYATELVKVPFYNVRDVVVLAGKGVHGGAVDLASGGRISAAKKAYETFQATRGSDGRAGRCRRRGVLAAADERDDAGFLGGAEGRLQHAENLVGIGAIDRGTSRLFNGIVDGDFDAAGRGFARGGWRNRPARGTVATVYAPFAPKAVGVRPATQQPGGGAALCFETPRALLPLRLQPAGPAQRPEHASVRRGSGRSF